MSTLKIYLVTAVIIALAMVQPVYADGALSLSGGVSLTQKTPATNMGSRVDAWRSTKIVASWVSTSNKLLKMPKGPAYVAYSDFTGISRVESAYLTPDDGITKWPAKKLVGKGWQVQIPYEWVLTCGSAGGGYGAYGLKWVVNSRDERNQLIIFVIPLTWNSHRASESLNQVVFEEAPWGHEAFSSEDWALYLSLHCGFESVVALPDLNFEAQRQALDGFRATHQEQSETPVEQSATQPEVRERSAPTPPRKKAECVSPRPAPMEERERSERVETKIDEEPYREVVGTAPMTIVVLSGSREYTLKASLEAVGSRDTLVFKRGENTIGKARVTSVGRKVFATMTSGNIATFRRGDFISVQEGR